MSVGLLWLEGPLQSWGYDSRFGRRATLEFPTRSGILGMVASAMAKKGPQREWLAKMRNYGQTIIAYQRKDLPQAPQLEDFHMVGSGYDRHDPWQDLLIPKKSDGKRPSGAGPNAGSRLTYRYYLQDMAFACVIDLPPDEAEAMARALANPAWQLCLGRKCCVPTDIIWRGIFPDRANALARAAEIANEKKRRGVFSVWEGSFADGDVSVLNDVPIEFGLYKRYTGRIVSKIDGPVKESTATE